VSLIVLLDTGPLGLATQPKARSEAEECRAWLRGLPSAGHLALVPEIADYELRRELKLYNRLNGLRLLDRFRDMGVYLPLTTAAVDRASDLWAQMRKQGTPTADRFALDGDMLLAAQALTLNSVEWRMGGAQTVIATTNVAHLSRVVPAQHWRDIS
jgi:predicted nucleic acid-binding protein